MKVERCGFLSEKPQGWGPSAAAASGAAPTAEQGNNPSTATAPCQGQGRSAHPALAEYLAPGGCMKTKKGRHEAPICRNKYTKRMAEHRKKAVGDCLLHSCSKIRVQHPVTI